MAYCVENQQNSDAGILRTCSLHMTVLPQGHFRLHRWSYIHRQSRVLSVTSKIVTQSLSFECFLIAFLGTEQSLLYKVSKKPSSNIGDRLLYFRLDTHFDKSYYSLHQKSRILPIAHFIKTGINNKKTRNNSLLIIQEHTFILFSLPRFSWYALTQ